MQAKVRIGHDSASIPALLALLCLLRCVDRTSSFLPPSCTWTNSGGHCNELNAIKRKKDKSIINTGMAPICRIVTRSGAKIPTTTPPSLIQQQDFLDKLDAFYHAESRQRTKNLRYLGPSKQKLQNAEAKQVVDRGEEEKLVSEVRGSLEDAGFELMSRRDLDLCESLNAEYLLRLSILPDVKELDSGLAREFYPKRFGANGTVLDENELLFGGRVLVYWRGYSEEVTRGRLVLPKLDYLQASIVQRSAAWVKHRLDAVESELMTALVRRVRIARRKAQRLVVRFLDSIPVKFVAKMARDVVMDDDAVEGVCMSESKVVQGRPRLSRYGGSKIKFVGSPNPDDALGPFTICEVNYDDPSPVPNANAEYLRNLGRTAIDNTTSTAAVEHDIYEEVNNEPFTCQYDAQMSKNNPEDQLPPMQLLERVSISNLVDLFTTSGRRSLLKEIASKSELVEPTYEEVVVVWRPMIEQQKNYYPPKVVSEFADMFDIEGFEAAPEEGKEPPLGQLEIRNFAGVPMANLPAVSPKTKLVFRPADAFLFDFISFATFLLVVSSVRLDSPGLDLLALISVGLWTFRTVIRYSNKLARYDLLVKKFLTSKITHRNSGALKYLTSEAGSQRAQRALLVHAWLSHEFKLVSSPFAREDEKAPPILRSLLKKTGVKGVNKILKTEKQIDVDVDKAMIDLEDLRLVTFSRDGEELLYVQDPITSIDVVRRAWKDLLEGEYGSYRKNSREETRKADGDETVPVDSDIAKDVAETVKSLVEKGESFRVMLDEIYNKEDNLLGNKERSQDIRESLRLLVEKGESFRGILNEKYKQGGVVSNDLSQDLGESLKLLLEKGESVKMMLEDNYSNDTNIATGRELTKGIGESLKAIVAKSENFRAMIEDNNNGVRESSGKVSTADASDGVISMSLISSLKKGENRTKGDSQKDDEPLASNETGETRNENSTKMSLKSFAGEETGSLGEM